MPFAPISSTKNERIKAAVKLRRRKHRGKHGRTLIDGARELFAALNAEIVVIEIFFCPDYCQSAESRRLLERVEELRMQVFEVTPAVFDRLAYGERGDGFVAVALPAELSLDDLQLPACPLVAVLEAVEKPGNLGAVLRTADAAGVSAVILADARTDLYNPNAIRASLGTVFSMPVCAATTSEALAWLRLHHLKMYAARIDGRLNYYDIDFSGGAAVIFGAEATGLSAAWTAPDITPIRIPMRGVADSLNVSTAAAVLFYEALRQDQACEKTGALE